jgi:3-oxoacyl-[acyl-carrier protein] reductase
VRGRKRGSRELIETFLDDGSSIEQTSGHVIISGGSRGLGQALIEGMLGIGYCVSTFSRKPTEFTESFADHERFYFGAADIADNQALAAFVRHAEARFGTPSGLVNCAGVAVVGVLATMPDHAIDRVLSINLAGALHLTRLVVRRMMLRNMPGSIVNISSVVGLRGYRGLGAYAAAKAGMDGMTRALAREVGERKIRVNSIAPGYLETEMTHGLDDAQRRQIINRTPLGRLGHPVDVVGPTLFLLSDQSAFITGQVLVVDGGMTS